LNFFKPLPLLAMSLCVAVIGAAAYMWMLHSMHGHNHGAHTGHGTNGHDGQSYQEIQYASVTRESAGGAYQVELTPADNTVPLLQLHHWFARFFLSDGSEIRPQQIVLSGGMEAHGHGLPTEPKLSQYVTDKGFQIDGVRFNMAGIWSLRVEFVHANESDYADFELEFPVIEHQREHQTDDEQLKDDKSMTDATHTMSHDKKNHLENDPAGDFPEWSEQEISLLETLSLKTGHLEVKNTGNHVADNMDAAELGHALFFDQHLSGETDTSCASCHIPENYFTDTKTSGNGIPTMPRNTPSIVGAAFSTWLYWDGRRDSLWSQALAPIEAAAEMAGNRLSAVKHIYDNYNKAYEAVFGDLPALDFASLPAAASPVTSETDQNAWNALDKDTRLAIDGVFVNIGKAIAAYEMRLLPAAGPFDNFVDELLSGDREAADSHLGAEQQAGLKLFISTRTQCMNCHVSPMFSNHGFHNIGTGLSRQTNFDFGRMLGIQAVLLNEFNCRGIHNSERQAGDPECDELRFINDDEASGMMKGAFRVPSLRGLKQTAPYMHDGRYKTLEETIRHYSEPAPELLAQQHEIPAIEPLDDAQVQQIASFLHALGDGIAGDEKWRNPPRTRKQLMLK